MTCVLARLALLLVLPVLVLMKSPGRNPARMARKLAARIWS